MSSSSLTSIVLANTLTNRWISSETQMLIKKSWKVVVLIQG
ncbi:1154_t:CDS:2 [Gigaspora margarita]|uniref:1154_t:CDS:1 n=1 Tax=Gigaspora margarita TaxID=4874 RepID=A0ABM8VX27_GIGMA|nr:1154_t:CDS:2 [Gigaspora margarita]